MRVRFALGSLLLVALLTGLAATAAAAENDPLTIKAPSRAYIASDFDALVATHGAADGATLEITVTPALQDASLLTPPGASCALDAGTWTCTLSAADGDSQVFTVTGAPTGEAAEAGRMVLSAKLGDETASDSVRVLPRAGFQLMMPAGGAEMSPGQTANLNAMTKNAGPSAAPGVLVVTAPLDQFTIQAPNLAPEGASCVAITENGRGGQRCELTLAVNQFDYFSFPVTVLDGESLPETRVLNGVFYPAGSFAGHERVYYSALDKNLGDNSASTVVKVPAPKTEEEKKEDENTSPTGTGSPDNSGTPPANTGGNEQDKEKVPEKADGKPVLTTALTGPADLVVGKEGTYTLVVSNTGDGASKAFGATTVVTGVGHIVSAQNGDASCSVTGARLSCLYPPIKAGEAATVTLQVAGAKAGDIKLVTTSSAATGASIAAVVKQADIDLAFVTFSASPSTVKAGEKVTVTITVKNLGDTAARTVTLNAPTGGVEFDGSAGPCVKSGASVRCFLGTIGAGETRTLNIELPADAPGGYSAEGSVSHSGKDPNASNDRQTLHVTVEP